MLNAGPVTFYCAAEGCTKFAPNDEIIWCDYHDCQFPLPPIKNGYSVEGWKKMIANAREQERQQGWTTTDSTGQVQRPDIIDIRQMTQHHVTDGLGQQHIMGCRPSYGERNWQRTIEPLRMANLERKVKKLEEDNSRLSLENDELRRQNTALRQMIPLFRTRVETFLRWMEKTVDGIH